MRFESGTRLGMYEVLAPLGVGGMGEVYRARDTRLDRQVAIKVLKESFLRDHDRVARFAREARLLASLDHPNIAVIHGLEEVSGTHFLVMELVPGATLAQRLASGPIPVREALNIGRQIAEAVEAAHAKVIVHRDLKPGNVKVTPEGKVKVLDFGLAKALEPDQGPVDADGSTATVAATGAGWVFGTPGYMSPEQALGKPVDTRTDIWSFGCVLYEILTRRRAFPGESAAQTLASVLQSEPDLELLPPAVPESLKSLIRRCLQKDAHCRLRDIGDARIELEESAAASTGRAPAAARPLPKRNRGLLAAWAVAAVSLALAVYSMLLAPATALPSAKFDFHPPARTSLEGSIAVSPDGRYVVFAATTPEGATALYLRDVGSLDARPVPGTEGALYPFWSPDSRFLGFFADRKLKKVRTQGGPPQVLANVFDARGGAWSKDGVIVYSPNTGDSLLQIPASGGEPKAVTTLNPSRQENSHQWPAFLPDGRHFLYLCWSPLADVRGIYGGSLDGGQPVRILGSESGAVYARVQGRRGDLLFLRGRTILAQGFDPGSGRLSGEAIPVAEEAWYDATRPGLAAFSVSDSGVFAYRAGGFRATQLTWFDRSGKQLESVGPPGAYRDLALSPNEHRVAVSRVDPQSGTHDVWVLELSRDVATRLTYQPSDELSPLWSPDGQYVAYSAEKGGAPNLFQRVATGAGDELLLLKTDSSVYGTDWSAARSSIVYAYWDPKTSWDLWTVPVKPGASASAKPMPYQQGPFDAFQAAFSPDGRWIAYTANESNRYEVYVQPYPPTSSRWQVSSNGGAQAFWRGDSRELFYIAPDRKLMSVEIRAGAGFETAPPKPLFQTRITGLTDARNHFVASRDGQRFLVNTIVQEGVSSPVAVFLNWHRNLR